MPLHPLRPDLFHVRSRVVLNRIEHLLDSEISHLQHAYVQYKSTAEVVLAHKLLKGATEEYDIGNIVIAGIDMSKAFDTVPRARLLDLLYVKFPRSPDLKLVKLLLSNTTPCLVQIWEFRKGIVYRPNYSLFT